jgi:hypothetical protein
MRPNLNQKLAHALTCFAVAALAAGSAQATEPSAADAEPEAKPVSRLSPSARVTPAAAPWRNVNDCPSAARGKVVSAQAESIRGQPGVRVKAKSISGSTLNAGIQHARESDFPAGAGFCKIDF